MSDIALNLHDKESIVALMFDVQNGKTSCRRAATEINIRYCTLFNAAAERGEALASLKQTCATNTEIRRELEEAHREIAKLKASSNENYWELSRQRGNMLFALHKIADAVRYGFKHGSKSGEEVK